MEGKVHEILASWEQEPRRLIKYVVARERTNHERGYRGSPVLLPRQSPPLEGNLGPVQHAIDSAT